MSTNELFVVNLFNNDCFTICKPDEVEKTIERAKEFYQRDVETYEHHLIHYPNMADEWTRGLNHAKNVLASGFEAVTWEEFRKRERKRWLDTEAKEITLKEFDDALNCLPPVNWVRNERYSMFHISEATSGSFHGQYLYNRETGKCYYAMTDIRDESTWIDKILKLVA